MSFQGMIFDMGGTLLHFTPAGQTWEDAEKLANRAVYEYLRRLEYTLPPETEALEAAWQTTQETWAGISQADVKSLKLSNVLGLIAGGGCHDLPTDVYQTCPQPIWARSSRTCGPSMGRWRRSTRCMRRASGWR